MCLRAFEHFRTQLSAVDEPTNVWVNGESGKLDRRPNATGLKYVVKISTQAVTQIDHGGDAFATPQGQPDLNLGPWSELAFHKSLGVFRVIRPADQEFETCGGSTELSRDVNRIPDTRPVPPNGFVVRFSNYGRIDDQGALCSRYVAPDQFDPRSVRGIDVPIDELWHEVAGP